MRTRFLLAALLPLSFACACSFQEVPASRKLAEFIAIVDLSDLRERIKANRHLIDRDLGTRQWNEAERELESILADARFDRLEPIERADVWERRALLAGYREDSRAARKHRLMALGIRPEWAYAWRMLAYTQYDLREFEDSARSLTHGLAMEPKAIQNATEIIDLVDELEMGSPVLLRLLSIVPPSQWRTTSPDAGQLWHRLALERLRAGDTAGAKAALQLIDTPQAVIRVRVDKRFDGLYDRDSKAFDVASVSRARIAAIEAMVAEHPKLLWHRQNLLIELNAAGRFAEALRQADEILGSTETYEDKSRLPRIRNQRARALRALGRHDESMKELADSASAVVDKRFAVGAYLYLASEQCASGRGKDVLASTPAPPRPTARFDTLEYHYLRHCGALLTGDESGAAKALEYLRTHREGTWGRYFKALLRADRMDEAATLFIEVLASERDRDEALFWAQDYRRLEYYEASDLRRKSKEFMGRDDVKRAIAQVGRIENVDYFF